MNENSGTRFLIVLLMASFAVVPMVIYGCGPEWARWDAAQANQYFRMGETEDALYQLRDAVKKSPRDPVIRLTLARRLVELDKPDKGLELVEEVLELYPDNQPAMLEKVRCQQHLGDFDAALETWLKYDKLLNAFNRDAGTLNEVAYFRSLTGKDLHIARRDIEQAVAYLNGAVRWNGDDGIRPPIRSLAISAMVARCCDASGIVLPELSRQIDGIQGQINEFETALLKRAYETTKELKTTSQIEIIRQQLREYERELATLLTVRALLRQDASEDELCHLDRNRVVKLGFDATEIAGALPDEQELVRAIPNFGALLDTRGFVCAQMPWMDSETDLRKLNEDRFMFNSCFDSALTDLNVALVCAQVHLRSLDCQLSNTIDFIGDRESRKESWQHTIAVIRNHLATLYSRAEMEQEASDQKKEIRKLGFEPGASLF